MSNFTNLPSVQDLSDLCPSLNPFGESMAAGNTLTAKGPFSAPGSDSEQAHSVFGDVPEFDISGSDQDGDN